MFAFDTIILTLISILGAFAAYITANVLCAGKNNTVKSFIENVEEILDEDEKIETVCDGVVFAALTNKHLFVQNMENGDVDVIPYSEIREIKGMTGAKTTTSKTELMSFLDVYTDEQYRIPNLSESFKTFVFGLEKHCRV